MKEITDKDVLAAYMCGWHHENDIYAGRKVADVYKDETLMKAYNVGREHYLLGDDSPKFDALTNEEILNIIKKGKQNYDIQ